MDPRTIATRYLAEASVMQIATMHGDQPRVNSVYFVAVLDEQSIYWLSEPHRRHSRDIGLNPRVSGAIAVKAEVPVAGLQFIGTAEEVTALEEIGAIATQYAEKYDGIGRDLSERYQAGTNKHRLYKLSITQLELFDEVHFPGGEVVTVPLL